MKKQESEKKAEEEKTVETLEKAEEKPVKTRAKKVEKTEKKISNQINFLFIIKNIAPHSMSGEQIFGIIEQLR